MKIQIQILKKQEINQIAKIASQCFSGMKDLKKSQKWIKCNFKAFPRMKYFVAKNEKNIIMGYVLWMEKAGFRNQAVWELEQIAVAPDFRNQGVGTRLITDSLKHIQTALQKRGAKLKLIEISTGTDNQARKLYKKVLNAKPECKIKDLYRGDEVLMIARF